MKAHLVTAWLCLLVFSSAFAAPRKPAQDASSGSRFLFVVETSNAMLPLEHAGRQAVFDLLYSGIGHQMQTGDTFGIWTLGEEVHGGMFPMQVWQPEQNLHSASMVGLFLKNQRYENQARIEKLIPKLLSLIRGVKNVNVLLVSGTQFAWNGTSFDRDINLLFEKKGGESRAAKQPLITTLIARNGEIVSWSVTLPGEPIPLPNPSAVARTAQPGGVGSPRTDSVAGSSNDLAKGSAAIAAKPSEAQPGTQRAVTKPSAPPNASVTAPPATPVRNSEKPAVPIKSIVITSKGSLINGEMKAADLQTTVAAREPAAVAIQPHSVPSSPSEQQPAVSAPKADVISRVAAGAVVTSEAGMKTKTPETAATPGTAPVRPIVPPAAEVSPAANPSRAPLPALLPATMTVAARENPLSTGVTATASSAAPLAMASPPDPFLTSRTLFLIGAGLVVVAVSLLFLALRSRAAPRPSFITRSFDRDKP